MCISVGFIGYRNHAERLRKLFIESGSVVVHSVYSPRPVQSEVVVTNSLDYLLGADAVVIASPSNTHFEYLEWLTKSSYTGYIFCEKPLVTSPSEFSKVKNLNLNVGKLHINFNYRYSKVKEVIDFAISEGNLGNPIFFYAVSNQGLAFSRKYIESWRSDITRHRLGVTETKSIHYIDLAICLFGEPTRVAHRPRNISGNGTAIDTSVVELGFGYGESATILTSYAAPLRQAIEVIGTNGYVIYDGQSIKLYSPRETFSTDGRFSVPPVVQEVDFDKSNVDMHTDSLRSSVNYFLEICRKQRTFPAVNIEASYKSTECLLGLAEFVL